MGGGSHAPNSPVEAFAVPTRSPQHVDEDSLAVGAIDAAIENFLSMPEHVDMEEQVHLAAETDTEDTSSMLANFDMEEDFNRAIGPNLDFDKVAGVESYLAKLREEFQATSKFLATSKFAATSTQELPNLAKLFQSPIEDYAFLDQYFQDAKIPAGQRESFRDGLRKAMDAQLATVARESPDLAEQSQGSNAVNASLAQSYRGPFGQSDAHTRRNESVTGDQFESPYLGPQGQGSNAMKAAWEQFYGSGISQAQSRQNASVIGGQSESATTGPGEVMEPYLPKPFGTQPYVPSSFDCDNMSPPTFGYSGYEPYAPYTSTRPSSNLPYSAFPGFPTPGYNYPGFTAAAPKIKQTLRWTASDSRRTRRQAHSNHVAETEQQQRDRDFSELQELEQLALRSEQEATLETQQMLSGHAEDLSTTSETPTLADLQQQDMDGWDRFLDMDQYSRVDDLGDLYGGYKSGV